MLSCDRRPRSRRWSTLPCTDCGKTKRIDEAVVGDRVHVGGGTSSKAFMFTDKSAEVRANFVRIRTASQAVLMATSGYYAPAERRGIVAMKRARVGDRVRVASGGVSEIQAISIVVNVWLYNPQTFKEA